MHSMVLGPNSRSKTLRCYILLQEQNLFRRSVTPSSCGRETLGRSCPAETSIGMTTYSM